MSIHFVRRPDRVVRVFVTANDLNFPYDFCLCIRSDRKETQEEAAQEEDERGGGEAERKGTDRKDE